MQFDVVAGGVPFAPELETTPSPKVRHKSVLCRDTYGLGSAEPIFG